MYIDMFACITILKWLTPFTYVFVPQISYISVVYCCLLHHCVAFKCDVT